MKHFVNRKILNQIELSEKIEIKHIKGSEYRIQSGPKHLQVFLIESKSSLKTSSWWINGEKYIVNSETDLDQLLKKLGMNSGNEKKINELYAPMPGLILSVKFSNGDKVKKGDTILILEAMKMENLIKSQITGVIKKIYVKEGESIEKNSLLVSFDS
jgi:biotin carboxyl carrier protein